MLASGIAYGPGPYCGRVKNPDLGADIESMVDGECYQDACGNQLPFHNHFHCNTTMRRYLTKDNLEPIDVLLGIGWKLTLSAGALVLFLYCATERVVPDGVTAGDALLLVFSMLCFGLIVTIGTFYGAVSTLWLIRTILAAGNYFLRRAGRPLASLHSALDSKFLWGAVSPFCFFIFALAFLIGRAAGNNQVLHIVLFFTTTGFLLACYFGTRPPNGEKVGWRLAIMAFCGAVFVGASIGSPRLLDLTMATLGIRTQINDALVVGQAERARIEAWSRVYGIALRSCAIDNSDQWILHNAVGVWHGMGATSYVRVGEAPNGGQKSVLIPVAAKELTVLRQRDAAYRCSPQQAVASS